MCTKLLNELIEAIRQDREPKGKEFEEATRKSWPFSCIFGDRLSAYRKTLPPEQQLARIYADYRDKGYFLSVCGEERKKMFIQYLKDTMV